MALQLTVDQTPDTEHAAPRVAGIVLGAVQPFTVFVEHRVAIKVPIAWCAQGLHEAAVTTVDQIALGARPAPDKQRQRLLWMHVDIVAAAGHLGAECLRTIQPKADGVVPPGTVVAGGQQQRLAGLLAQGPAAQRSGTEQGETA